ncbi:MAG: DUF3857 domain-containing protein, partial [Bacteroidota bacterium]
MYLYPELRLFLLGAFLLTTPTLAVAQFSVDDIHPRLGDVDPNWIETEAISGYEEESAVILMDYGAVEFDIMGNLPRLRYTFHRRIKIQDEAAAEAFRKIEIPYYTKENRETFLQAQGGTVGLNAKGESVLFKLDSRRISTPKTDGGGRKIVLEFPLVKVGSIIEYRYVLSVREYQTLKPWYFQRDLPIVASSYHAYIPSAFEYLITAKGDIRNLQRRSTQYTPRSMYQPQGVRNVGNVSANLGSRENYGYYFTGTHHSYTLTNVAALTQEEFSPETSDFIPSVYFQLQFNRF